MTLASDITLIVMVAGAVILMMLALTWEVAAYVTRRAATRVAAARAADEWDAGYGAGYADGKNNRRRADRARRVPASRPD